MLASPSTKKLTGKEDLHKGHVTNLFSKFDKKDTRKEFSFIFHKDVLAGNKCLNAVNSDTNLYPILCIPTSVPVEAEEIEQLKLSKWIT